MEQTLFSCTELGCSLVFATQQGLDEHVKTHTPQTEQAPQEPVKKHAGGRPCEFCKDKERILKVTQEYIDGRKSLDKPKMPFIGELAILLDKDDETITLWAEKEQDGVLEHPEFSALIKKFKTIQHLRLQQRLLGRYNPTGTIMWLKTKYGYIETEKKLLVGDKNQPIQVNAELAKYFSESNEQ
jgi:hypothetical protein